MFAFKFFATFITVSLAFAHSGHHHIARGVTVVGHNQTKRAVSAPEFQLLVDGNKAFRDKTSSQTPNLLKTLTDEGQAPPFMFIGCSDSRASEGTMFDAKPGTLFTERNIANQFLTTDTNTHAVLSYAVAELGVKHVIVMGHYGCGGVAASIASRPEDILDVANGVIQSWIEPIREIFRTSSRPEIIELRERIKGQTVVEEPDIREPGFRALVEENIKASVTRIAGDSVIANHYRALSQGQPGIVVKRSGGEKAAPADVYIHGWVYDIENGEIRDLNISVGPPGKEIPAAPWQAVVQAAAGTTGSHNGGEVLVNNYAGVNQHEIRAKCEQACTAQGLHA